MWQWMQYFYIGFGVVEIVGVKNKLCFYVGVFGWVQMFFLYVGYVQDVNFCYYFFNRVVQILGDFFFIKYIQNVLWYCQCVWCDEVKMVVVEFC